MGQERESGSVCGAHTVRFQVSRLPGELGAHPSRGGAILRRHWAFR